MSEETIPLTFTAVDNLSKAVQNMTTILEKMGVVQDKTSASTEKATQLTSVQAAAYDNLSKITNKVLTDREKMMASLDIEAIGLQEVSLARKNANVEDLIAIKRVQELAKLELELAEITDEEVKAKTRLIRTTQINNNLMEEANRIVEERKNAKLEEQLKREEDRAQKWESIMSKSAAVLAVVAVGVAGVTAVVSKANEAWDKQSKKLGKSASSLGSIAEANAKAEKAQTKLYASIGKAIDRSGVFQTKAILQTQAMKALQGWVESNSKAIADFGNNVAIWGSQKIQEFGKFISDNAETFARFQLYLEGVAKLFVTAGYGVVALAKALKIGLYVAIGSAAEGLSVLTEGLIKILELSGQDVPQALEDLRLGMKGIAEGAANDAVDSFDSLNKTLDNVGEYGSQAFSAIGTAATASRSEIDAQTKAWEKGGKAVEGYGKKAEESLKKAQGGKGKSRKDLIDAETAAEEKRQTLVLRYENAILTARKKGKELLAIRLEGELATVKAVQEASKVKTKELATATLINAQLRSQVELEEKVAEKRKKNLDIFLNAQKEAKEKVASRNQSLKALEAESKALEVVVTRQWDQNETAAVYLETQQKMIELQAELAEITDPVVRAETEKVRLAQIQIEEQQKLKEIEEERFAIQTERISQVGDYIAEAFGGISSVIDNISESTQRMIDGFAKAAPQVTGLVNSFRAYNKQGATVEQQQEAFNQSLNLGVGILGTATDAFIDSERKKALMLALINAAAAAAAFASGIQGNPAGLPAAIQYGVAAAGYGAAAAFSGGGGAPSGGSAGGGVSAPSMASFDRDAERRANAEAIAEALGGNNGQAGGIIINVDFGSSTNLESSPQTVQRISDALAPELEKLLRR